MQNKTQILTIGAGNMYCDIEHTTDDTKEPDDYQTDAYITINLE